MKKLSSILVSGNKVLHESCNVLETGRYLVVWDGFIYNERGESQSTALINSATELVAEEGIGKVAEALRGNYFLVFYDKINRSAFSFIDGSGLFTAYHGCGIVSRNFIELFEKAELSIDDLDSQAMMEFLQLGHLCRSRSLSKRIRKIRFDEILVSGENGVKTIRKPALRLTDTQKYKDLFSASEALANSLKNSNVSIDLTGGYDSRLMACLLKHHGNKFETALSGYVGHIDQVIGCQVAQALDVPYNFTEYRPESIVDVLDDLMKRSDGTCGYLEVCHRLVKFGSDRQSRGVDVTLKGQGGEMYKDFFWTQDFPFYNSRKTNISRLDRMRIEMELLSPKILQPYYFSEFQKARLTRQADLENYVCDVNTQSYDNVYFRERIQSWNSRTITSSQSASIPSHSPLCEVELAQIGFNQMRRKRFYSRMHREYISKVNSDAAAIVTTDGTTARSDWKGMSIDAFGYSKVKAHKLSRKVGELVLNKTYLRGKGYDINLNASTLIHDSAIGIDALTTLKENNIVFESVNYRDISPRFRTHFTVLGWFLKHYC